MKASKNTLTIGSRAIPPEITIGRLRTAGCASLLAAAVFLCPAGAVGAKGEAALATRIAAGDSLRARGALDEAMREYVAALAIDDESCEANYGMARIALAREDVAAAALHAGRAEEEADCDLGLVAVALVRIAEGKLDAGEAALYKVGTRDLPDETRREVELAFIALYKSKQYPLLVVEHIDKLFPLVEEKDKTPLILEKGRLLAGEKKYDEALAAFQQAIAADSMAADAYKEIATLYTRAKRPADAAEVLTRLGDATKSVDAYLMAGETWSTAERPAEARAAYQKAADLDPACTPAWLGLARSAYETGDREVALTAYRNLGPTKVLGARDNMNLGRVLLENKQYEEAREAFERAAALDSSLTDAHFFIGNAYFGEKKYAEAVPHYEKSVALDPARAAALVNLGQALVQSGKVTRGIEALEQAVTLRPEDNKTRLYLAQSLASQTQWSKAVQQYKAILDAEPDNADALRGMGYCLLNQERYVDAIGVLAKANSIEPGNVQGLVWLAQGYGMAGELDKSESTFRKVLAIEPGSQEAKTGLDTLEKSRKGKRRSG